jgi:hypothetical protein
MEGSETSDNELVSPYPNSRPLSKVPQSLVFLRSALLRGILNSSLSTPLGTQWERAPSIDKEPRIKELAESQFVTFAPLSHCPRKRWSLLKGSHRLPKFSDTPPFVDYLRCVL